MSDYQPKVGDKVMVGEHGPYEVARVECYDGQQRCHVRDTSEIDYCVPIAWLAPVPEPEPDEPTAPGALVRTGTGSYAVYNGEGWTIAGGAWAWPWDQLIRPVSVVLSDPAEVEALREERDQRESDYQEAMRQVDGLRAERDAYRKAEQENDERFQLEAAAQRRRADELQRRIERFEEYVTTPTVWAAVGSTGRRGFMRILRGES